MPSPKHIYKPEAVATYRRQSGHSASPLINVDGPDRIVPIELQGVPQITPRLAAATNSGRPLNAYEGRRLQAVVRRATAELRRRYEQHNEQVRAAIAARDAEEEFDDAL